MGRENPNTVNDRLDRLYREESRNLLAFIERRLSDPEEAEDVLQEVFSKAAEAPSFLDPVENLLGWLYAAAKNKIIDRYRSRSREREKRMAAQGIEDIEDLIEDSGLPVEDEYVRSLVEAAIEDAIEDLPDEQRTVFIRQELEGFTFREMAEESGVSINTLMARKRYAVLFLKKRLSVLKKIVEDGGAL